MKIIAEGWCTEKQLRLDQTIRSLTCGDLEIPYASNGIEKVQIGVPPGLIWGKRGGEVVDLVCVKRL